MAIYSSISRIVKFSLATSLFPSSDDMRELSRFLEALDSVVLRVGYKHVAGLVETNTHGLLELGNSGSGLAVGGSDSSDSWSWEISNKTVLQKDNLIWRSRYSNVGIQTVSTRCSTMLTLFTFRIMLSMLTHCHITYPCRHNSR